MTEEKLNKTIGKNVRKYRLLYNANGGEMTQRELASKVGVSVSMIGALESKNMSQGVSLYNLYKISKVLKCPLENFIKE